MLFSLIAINEGEKYLRSLLPPFANYTPERPRKAAAGRGKVFSSRNFDFIDFAARKFLR